MKGFKKFEIISKLGKGQFSEVYKVKMKEGNNKNIYALKKVKLSTLNYKGIIKEMILTCFRIIRFFKRSKDIGFNKRSLYHPIPRSILR